MSWYQENKFAGNLLGITAVISGALIYLGVSANSEASAAIEQENAAVKKIDSLQAAVPYPNRENKKLLSEELAAYAVDAKSFQDQLLAFRPKVMPKLSPVEFSDMVSNYVKNLNGYYQEKGVTFTGDGEPFYGMEAYAGVLAQESSTRYLSYHTGALEWLFKVLADSEIDSLNNVYRAQLAEQLGKAPKVTEEPKKKRKKRKKKNAKSAPKGVTSVADNLPIEITFTGSEASLQTFLTSIAASDKYFFAPKFVKIINEEQLPVVISEATFAPVVEVKEMTEEEDQGPGDPFDFNFNPGGAPEMEKDKEIIKQVIGDEKITVFMQLDLILLKEADSVVIPGLKKETAKSVESLKPSTK